MEQLLNSDEFTHRVYDILHKYFQQNQNNYLIVNGIQNKMPVNKKFDSPMETTQKDLNNGFVVDTGSDSTLKIKTEDTNIQSQYFNQLYYKLDEKIKLLDQQILEQRAYNLQLQQETLEQMERMNNNILQSLDNTKADITLNLKQQLKSIEKSFNSKIISEVESIVGRQSQQIIQVNPPQNQDLIQSVEDLRIIMLKQQECFIGFVYEQNNVINQIEQMHTLQKDRDSEIQNSLTQIQDRLTLVWQGMDFLSQEYWKGQNNQTRRNSEIININPRKKFIIF